ncbi:MAG: hypothetical protein MUE85_24630 [Microscillaceae bacterium]|jgi:uncharacterized protein (DUF2062 family)|nr:hypothetical protein [Microscillaceae bacterium]
MLLNQISFSATIRKYWSYQAIYKVLSDFFVISFLGLLVNLLINYEHPLTHLCFAGGILLAILGGTLVEIIHRQRVRRRIIRKIQSLSQKVDSRN